MGSLVLCHVTWDTILTMEVLSGGLIQLKWLDSS